MKNNIKNKSFSLLISVIVVSLIFILISTPIIAKTTVNININGTDVNFSENMGYPFIDENSRTQVPFRVTVEEFGATVGWNSELRMAYAELNGIIVYAPIGENYIIVNGSTVKNDTYAVIVNNRTYCPIRKVLEALGGKVSWNSETKTVSVASSVNNTSNKNTANPIDSTNNSKTIRTQLTILTEFSDVKLSTSENDWNNFWYDDNNNSVSSYYTKMSNGFLEFQPANDSFGEKNNGIVKITLDMEHPNCTAENPEAINYDTFNLFEKIITRADKYIDFSEYDKDNNLIISPDELDIVIITAGYEESYYRPIESKAVSGVQIIEADYVYSDNVYLDTYVLSGELMYNSETFQDEISSIGIVCHELGHQLGLPDLYDTDYSSSGLEFHALMASGSSLYVPNYIEGTIPAPMTAWSRIQVNFIEPIEIKKSGKYTLYAQSSDKYNILKIPTLNPKEYFLLENRQIEGFGEAWTYYMEQGGIAIWRINEEVIENSLFENTVNDNENNYGVSLMEASGYDDLKQEILDYSYWYNHYYAKGYIDTFSPTTYPSSDLHDGTPTGITITVLDKSEDEMTITIDF